MKRCLISLVPPGKHKATHTTTHLSRWLKFWKTDNSKYCRDTELQKSDILLVEYTLVQPVWKTGRIYSSPIYVSPVTHQLHSVVDAQAKCTRVYQNTCTRMFLAALFLIAGNNQQVNTSMDKGLWYNQLLNTRQHQKGMFLIYIQHGWISQTFEKNERIYMVWFHLCKVEKLVKVTYGVRDKEKGLPLGRSVGACLGHDRRGPSVVLVTFSFLISVGITCIGHFIIIHKVIHLQIVHFLIHVML